MQTTVMREIELARLPKQWFTKEDVPFQTVLKDLEEETDRLFRSRQANHDRSREQIAYMVRLGKIAELVLMQHYDLERVNRQNVGKYCVGQPFYAELFKKTSMGMQKWQYHDLVSKTGILTEVKCWQPKYVRDFQSSLFVSWMDAWKKQTHNFSRFLVIFEYEGDKCRFDGAYDLCQN